MILWPDLKIILWSHSELVSLAKLNDRRWRNLVFINEIVNNFKNSEKKFKTSLLYFFHGPLLFLLPPQEHIPFALASLSGPHSPDHLTYSNGSINPLWASDIAVVFHFYQVSRTWCSTAILNQISSKTRLHMPSLHPRKEWLKRDTLLRFFVLTYNKQYVWSIFNEEKNINMPMCYA